MRVVTPFTLVMAYYDNGGMLAWHYGEWRQWNPNVLEAMHVIIVDDCSPNKPAVPSLPFPVLSQQIYRLRKDVRWNQDACRNIGVAHSETNWVLLTDIDHIVSASVAQYLMTREWDASTVYNFRRVSLPGHTAYKPHPNSWFMTRKLFDAAGGYDERFAGLYGTDGDFRTRITRVASEVVTLKQALIRVPREVVPDASTTNYLRKQPEDREGLARVYAERAAEEGWTTKRGTFAYDRVYPNYKMPKQRV